MLISRAAFSRLCSRIGSAEKLISSRSLTTALNSRKDAPKNQKKNITAYSTSPKNHYKSLHTSIRSLNKEYESFSSSKADDPIPEQALDTANGLKKGGQYDMAIRLYSEMLNDRPSNSAALIGRGECLLLKGEFALALPDLEKALGIDRMNAPLLLMIGSCFEGLNQHKKALKQYEQALFINEKYVDVYLARAALYSKLGEINRTIEDYKEALKHDTSTRIKILLADAYLRSFNIDAAMSLYNEIISKEKNNKEALAGLGIISYIQDDFPKAILSFSAALKLDPENVDLYAKRANCYLSVGNWERALGDSEKAISIKKDFHLAYLTRAQCYFRNKEYLKAANDFSFFLGKEEEEFKKMDLRSPSADHTAAYEQQKFDVLVAKASCYWYRDVIQRGYNPEIDFKMPDPSKTLKHPEKEISVALLERIKDNLSRSDRIFYALLILESYRISDNNLLGLAMTDYLAANKNPSLREQLVPIVHHFAHVVESVYRRPKKTIAKK